MNTPKTRPAEIVDLRLPDRNLLNHDTKTLVQTDDFRVIQLRLPAGSELPTYEAHGQIILHCLEGKILVRFNAEEFTLDAHKLLFLSDCGRRAFVSARDDCVSNRSTDGRDWQYSRGLMHRAIQSRCRELLAR